MANHWAFFALCGGCDSGGHLGSKVVKIKKYERYGETRRSKKESGGEKRISKN